MFYLEWAARREAVVSMLAAIHALLSSKDFGDPKGRFMTRKVVDALLRLKATTERDVNKLLLVLEVTGGKS